MGATTFMRMRKRNAEKEKQVRIKELSELKADELKVLAKKKGLSGYSDLKKDELIERLSEVI